MLFSELYSAYYNTVAAVLTEAVSHPVSKERLTELIEKYAFGESIVAIPEAFREERWQLLKADGTTPLKKVPSMPLTLLQKRWLKAVSCDPRIRLFGDFDFGLEDVEPLFLPSDVVVFDQYSDGDNYTDTDYIANFRMILEAIRRKEALIIHMRNRKDDVVCQTVLPEYLEYSEKDDKFRLIGSGIRFGTTINLGRIVSCRPYGKPFSGTELKRTPARPRHVVFEVTDQRNALERVLLHFAHFEKTAERVEGERYIVTVHYDKEDETEMVIRLLSFGPMVKVMEPATFVDLIKQRLSEQKSCGL